MKTHELTNPFLDSLGLRLTLWEDGMSEFRMLVTPRLGNRSGRIHGGVICTLLDVAAGYAGSFRPAGEPEAQSVTLSLTTQFLDSGSGNELKAIGRVQRRGRQVFFAQSEVWLDESKLLATALGTFKFVGTVSPGAVGARSTGFRSSP